MVACTENLNLRTNVSVLNACSEQEWTGNKRQAPQKHVYQTDSIVLLMYTAWSLGNGGTINSDSTACVCLFSNVLSNWNLLAFC